jgi:hypothetical protein
VKGNPDLIPFRGQRWSFRDLAMAHGIAENSLRKRYKAGKREAQLVAPVAPYRLRRTDHSKGLM